MRYFVFNTPEGVAEAASMVFASTLYQKPDAVFGLATGSTPVDTYRRLIALNARGLINFGRARSFNLDEYAGLAPDHPCSYRRFMDDHLFDHINIDKALTFVPSGIGDLEQNAAEYDQIIERAGGIDLQLLGIGHNGHIGFNEPDERAFAYRASVVGLTDSTIEANARFFANRDEVPRRAITLGLGGILCARRVLLLATGAGKARAVAGAIRGPVTPMNPASILQLHGDVQCLLDREAAALL